LVAPVGRHHDEALAQAAADKVHGALLADEEHLPEAVQGEFSEDSQKAAVVSTVALERG